MNITIRKETWSPVWVVEGAGIGNAQVPEDKVREWCLARVNFDKAQREMATEVRKAAEIARRLREKKL